jgi:hypothetical protein
MSKLDDMWARDREWSDANNGWPRDSAAGRAAADRHQLLDLLQEPNLAEALAASGGYDYTSHFVDLNPEMRILSLRQTVRLRAALSKFFDRMRI